MSESIRSMHSLLARRRFLIGLATVAGAAATAGKVSAAGVPVAARHWPLWSVERGSSKVFLFGETPPLRDDWHDTRIQGLLSRCPVLWTETNQTMRADIKELIERYGKVAGKPLAAWLTKDDHARLQKAADFCHVSLDAFADFRPWLVGANLQEAYYRAAGLSGHSADSVLAAQAVKAGATSSSEFAAQDHVFAWFGAMTPAQDVQFLRYALDEILAGPEAGSRIYLDWSAGRFERAAAVMNRVARVYPELFDKIAVQRNRNWLPRFHTMLEGKGPVLTVVGLYHLVGPGNLLAELNKSGMVVRRI
jgi:uncharacterized protein YbaP (TraB family)